MQYSTEAADCALSYATRGWHVIPLHSMKDGQCTCKRWHCKSPGKHPVFSNWQKKATTDPIQIRNWWVKYPSANIGIVTGQQSGLVVIDIDPRNGGDTSLQNLLDSYSAFKLILDTYTVRTGGNGNHYYYCYDKPFKSLKKHGLGPGIDIKADGGYVLAPPSNHSSGDMSSVESDTEPLLLPPILMDLISQGQSESSPIQPDILEGSRNNTLMLLGTEQFRQGKTLEQVKTFLLEENTLRCKPLLEYDEVAGIADSLASTFKPEATKKSFKTQWQEAIIESRLGSGFISVLIALSLWMDADGRNCFPTVETIAERIGMTRKSVSQHLKKAVKIGFLHRYPRTQKDRKGFSYGYIAKIPVHQDG
jgi:putative DNA primase/helicase